jgi:superfamily II DNA or RNA helicase
MTTKGSIALREYQEQARLAIEDQWAQGYRKTLLVLPTGTGKTVVFANVVADSVRKGERALILAHRGELLDQAADKLNAVTGLGCAVEKAEESSIGSWFQVTVGSVQSLMRENRLKQFKPDFFGTIVVDEAHHALADSYQRVLEHFKTANVLGVTATSDRGDKRSLGQYFDSIAYEYTLPAAIRDGFLCRITAQTIPLKLDLTGVGISQGDFKASDLGTALDPYLYQIADEMVAAGCMERKTVVFLPLIKTSQKFAQILAEKGFRSCEVNGESEARAEIIAAFDRGDFNVLCNSMLLTEGWDCPSVDCIVVLRPTKIRSLYAQMVGRGTRIHPGKENLLILDFLWHTATHELCHPASLICESEDVAKKMTKNLEEAGCPVDIELAEEQAAGDTVRDREEALAAKLAEMKHRARKLVDPLQYALSIQADDLADYTPSFAWEMAPASDKQVAALEQKGIFPDEVQSAGYASKLLDRLSKRQQEGLSTPKQIRQLENRGFQHVGTWQLEQASQMISRISANGWITPRGIDPATYIPEPIAKKGEFEPWTRD